MFKKRQQLTMEVYQGGKDCDSLQRIDAASGLVATEVIF
jgi:hypothetical protein